MDLQWYQKRKVPATSSEDLMCQKEAGPFLYTHSAMNILCPYESSSVEARTF